MFSFNETRTPQPGWKRSLPCKRTRCGMYRLPSPPSLVIEQCLFESLACHPSTIMQANIVDIPTQPGPFYLLRHTDWLWLPAANGHTLDRCPAGPPYHILADLVLRGSRPSQPHLSRLTTNWRLSCVKGFATSDKVSMLESTPEAWRLHVRINWYLTS